MHIFPAVSTLLISCAPSYTVVPLGAAARYAGTGTIPLSAQALRETLGLMIRAMGDSVRPDIIAEEWENAAVQSAAPSSSLQPDTRNIQTFCTVLHHSGYSVFSLAPAGCEGLHALSGLPVIVCIVILRFPGRDVTPVEDSAAGLGNLPSLLPRADALTLHIISATVPKGELWVVRTLDGLAWECRDGESIEGRVFTARNADGGEYYCQSIAHFCFSALPRFEIESHIRERFTAVSYTHEVPRVKMLY